MHNTAIKEYNYLKICQFLFFFCKTFGKPYVSHGTMNGILNTTLN